MQKFHSKKDAWLLILIYANSAICVVASAYVIANDVSITHVIIATFTTLVGGIAPVWLMASLIYLIDEQQLHVKCGPFAWTIDLSTIHSVELSMCFSSAPALSLDRLLINYGSGKCVLVSPEDKEGFKRALRMP